MLLIFVTTIIAFYCFLVIIVTIIHSVVIIVVVAVMLLLLVLLLLPLVIVLLLLVFPTFQHHTCIKFLFVLYFLLLQWFLYILKYFIIHNIIRTFPKFLKFFLSYICRKCLLRFYFQFLRVFNLMLSHQSFCQHSGFSSLYFVFILGTSILHTCIQESFNC